MTIVVERHAKQDRVTIHPEKSNAVLLKKPKSYSRWNLVPNIHGLVTDIQVNVYIGNKTDIC